MLEKKLIAPPIIPDVMKFNFDENEFKEGEEIFK